MPTPLIPSTQLQLHPPPQAGSPAEDATPEPRNQTGQPVPHAGKVVLKTTGSTPEKSDSVPIPTIYPFCPFATPANGARGGCRMDIRIPVVTAVGGLLTPPNSLGPLDNELSLTSLHHGQTSTPFEAHLPRMKAES